MFKVQKLNLLLVIYFIVIIIIIITLNTNKNNPINSYITAALMKNNINNHKIIYIINPTAGLANTLRGMASSIFLSYLINLRFYLQGWKSIIYYFDFPSMLIAKVYKNSKIHYKRFNEDFLMEFNKFNTTISLTDIHGFMNVLIKRYYDNINMKMYKKYYNKKAIDRRFINSKIYRELFNPSKYIQYYVKLFNNKKNGKKVLGLHIRSERFSINYTSSFDVNLLLKKFYKQSITTINNFNISFLYTISDNDIIFHKLKKHFGKLLINISFKGDIVHSRYALYSNRINDNAVRIVSEFIILSNCDIIIGTKGSSFSYESCTRLLKKCLLVI